MTELRPGVQVTAHGRQYRISHVLDLETVLAQELDTQTLQRLRIRDLEAAPAETAEADSDSRRRGDLAGIPDQHWRIAQERFAVIRPLLEAKPRTARQVKSHAKEAGVHMTTLYRWLERYEDEGRISALLPIQRDGGRGKSRPPAAVDAIVQATIEDYYLTDQSRSVSATSEEVKRRCRHAGLTPPHPNTVRYRISLITEQESLRRRGHQRQAQHQYAPAVDPFPGADWPLAVVQIDHTEADIVLVDDLQRQPVGRPWITVAIDVFSRLVTGFYVSLDPPGAMAVGLCLAQAILPKELWLAKYGIDTPWPVWGLPNVVHADNAKEFRGRMLERACQEYHIDLHWRPVARPQFGGHIERLCGTLNQAIQRLPGTTFSSPEARGEYPSAQRAALTLTEFEHWLAVYITQLYHQKRHQGLGTSPLQRFEQGIFGDGGHPGRGLPDVPADPDRLRLDFMPWLERTVQPYGLLIDDICYWQDVLKPCIRAADPDQAGAKRKFIVRRDPRDISQVYFYDPELNQYFAIPYRRLDGPSMSLWELRAIKRRLQEEGAAAIDEDAIFAGYERRRRIEAQAVKTTAQARRQAQRRRHHQDGEPIRTADTTPPSRPVAKGWGENDDITPFDDIQVGPRGER